ncbi:hypothetical protein ACFRAQ_36020 [Nocardia sp. NPDC056611]|uniref:hypothetical protein n=1 Tax=Nocardia sp. NPDC056611 TaxID=3345877 RepID=UPI00366B48A2
MAGTVTRFDTVVGLDLSLTATGIAVSTPGLKPWCGVIESAGKKGDPWETRYKRLGHILYRILPAIPDGALVVMEAPSYGSVTGHQHDRSGLWWMTYDLLAGSTRTVVPVEPTIRAKYGTGKGTSGKDAVLAAAVRRYPHIDINTNDEADAVILMAIGCRLIGAPIDDPLPVLQLAALNNLHLPEALTRRAA